MTSSVEDLRAELAAVKGMLAQMTAQAGMTGGDVMRGFIPAAVETGSVGGEIKGTPQLYWVLVARYWRPDGTMVGVDESPTSEDKLYPTWDMVRSI